jgi:hypothetical protein
MSTEHQPATRTIPLDPTLQERIEVYARAAGISAAEVVRRAFDQFEAGQNGQRTVSDRSGYDVLLEAGLIGALAGSEGTPTDLSTNPEHMEGFGRE